MSDIRQGRRTHSRSSEHRTGSRYRLLPPPNIEILQGDNGAPVRASLVDLSRGGCYVETDCALPLGTEVTITLRKGGDQVRAQARIVRTVPKKGLGLAFTSMEGKGFRILESWFSVFVARTWAETNRRRGQRVALQIEVRVSGYNGEGARFTEDTRTVVISGFGGLVILRTPVKRGQRLVLSNLQTKVAVECMVANIEGKGIECRVGLAFIVLNRPFWPVDFPPADWSPH